MDISILANTLLDSLVQLTALIASIDMMAIAPNKLAEVFQLLMDYLRAIYPMVRAMGIAATMITEKIKEIQG